MKHIFLYCALICCLSPVILHGQKATKGTQNPHLQQQNQQSEVYEQVIRIKFKPEQTSRLDAMLATKANRQGELNTRTGQPLQTGIQPIDRKNETFNANSMRRVFRPAGKFEDRHRAWGLHLWYEIRFTSNTSVNELMSAYAQVEGVEVTEPVFKYNLRDVENHEPLPYVWQTSTSDSQNDPQSVPNDPRYSEQWGFTRINAPQAWDIETGDPRVVVAIEDQGVDYTHPDLDGRMWTNAGETPGNGIDDDNNGYVDDYYGYNFGDNQGEIAIGYHGTHVGGTVAAETNNETGVAGTAGGWGDDQGVRLMSLSVFGANSQGGFDEAFIYAADMGAVISQNSWGGGSQSNALEDAIDYFIANAGGSGEAMEGGLVVFAAGNDNSSSTSMGYPASYEPVIAVASITNENKKSSFSNYGNWVDISAPGSDILSTYPVNQGSYNSISGTSMACPHVSGVAALAVSYNYGAITNTELRERLEGTTTDIYADNPNYEGMLGTGVVDAYGALTGEVAPPPPPSYCASRGNSVADEWIETVTIGDFTHNSGSNGGYANFTQSHTVELATGSSYDLSLTPGFSGTTYNEYWKIWVDLNGDKDFNDEGELVFDAGSLSSGTVNGTLSIAASQDTITTRMRVSMKYNGAPTSCEFFDYGEVEDYTVRIINGDTPPPSCGTPENLTAVNVSETTATLRWNAVEGADSYDIRYRSAADTVWAYLASESDSVELSNLQEGTTYEAQAAAVCGETTSEFSASINFTTDETAPPACDTPSGLAADEIGETTATLSWTAVEGADSYHVRYRQTASTDTVWADVETGTSSLQLSNLAEGTEYEAQVASVCGDTTSAYSGSVVFTTNESTPPSCETPEGLSVGQVTETTAFLQWNGVDGADGYTLRYRIEADSSWMEVSADSSSIELSGLAEGTTYQAQVAAVCADTTSEFSAGVTFTTEESAPVCEAPTGLSASDISETSVILSWNENPTADRYEVRYRTAEGDSSSWVNVAVNATSVELNNLAEGTAYEAQVASVCGEATSPYSGSVMFTTEEGTEPPVVEYCDAAGNNTSYFWIDLVRVGNMNNPNGNDGGYGDYTALNPGNLVKGASNSLVVSAGYSYWQFTLHWRIWIDYNQDGVFDNTEIFVSGTSNSAGELTATNTVPSSALSGNTRMRVAMRYTNYANPCGTFSYGEVEDYTVNIGNNAAASAFISRTTEAKSLTEGMEDALRAYPNPVRKQLKLSTEIPAGIKMHILDARGATVKTIISNEIGNELDVQDLKPGIYHLSIPTPLEAIHVQFLKL